MLVSGLSVGCKEPLVIKQGVGFLVIKDSELFPLDPARMLATEADGTRSSCHPLRATDLNICNECTKLAKDW